MPGPYYASARKIDPMTGEVVFNTATNTWDEEQPAAAIIAAVLNTPLGSAGRDRTYGIDLSDVDNARDNAAAKAENAIRRALDRWVKRGVFTLTSVDVEVRDEPGGTAAFIYAVGFKDRRGSSGTVRGTL